MTPPGRGWIDRSTSSTLVFVTLIQWQRYAALGDAGAWSVRLAGILQGSARLRGEEFEYADFAESPGLVHNVVDLQVPRALSMRADLVSIVVGSGCYKDYSAIPRRAAPFAARSRSEHQGAVNVGIRDRIAEQRTVSGEQRRHWRAVSGQWSLPRHLPP